MQQRHAGTITAGELALVCSHYDLGNITHVQKFPGGSRASPKVLLVGGASAYLLKRRAPGPASDPRTVALTHEIILHLEQRGIPAPELVGTRKDNNSMLQLAAGTEARRSGSAVAEGSSSGGSPRRSAVGRVYEVYRFVQGRSYARSTDDARSAGEMLARVHTELRSFRSEWPIPKGSFHAQPAVHSTLHRLAASTPDAAFAQSCVALADLYQRASGLASEGGIDASPVQLVHADWHPGNILFSQSDRSIAAILDFDSSRLAPALLDAANGSMQFSLGKHLRAGAGPSDELAISLNPDLFAAFWSGYNAGRQRQIPQIDAEIEFGAKKVVPWLMIEALIVEALVPIAATGRFDRFDAPPVLRSVLKAASSVAANADRLVSLAETA